ncbi:MAG: LysE family translocator [Pseudomonadota bacterium]
MMFELLLALVGFAFVSSITPGPNNLMLMASGANFGFSRTVPHMLGISVGHSFMIIMVGLGLIQLFEAFPILHTIMTVLSIAYLLYLAWKIANAAPPKEGEAPGTPLTFFQAAAFQWVNPKAWFMALTAITVYAPEKSSSAIALVALIFAMTNLPSICTWTVLGVQMRRWLTDPKRLRIFNWTMAICLVGTLAFLF